MWYWVFRTLAVLLLKPLFQLKVEGLENLPQKSNFIIVANHTSFLDPVVIMAAIPQKIHCIASRGLYRITWLRWFLRLTETIPSGNSSEKALHLLINNKNIGLFPEGGLSQDGKLREFKRGAALLGFKTGRPIVPCAILGAYEALPRGARFPKFAPIKVRVGRPRYLLKEFEEVIDDVYLQEGIFKIRNTIQEMIHAG